jgi:hypothetical protein
MVVGTADAVTAVHEHDQPAAVGREQRDLIGDAGRDDRERASVIAPPDRACPTTNADPVDAVRSTVVVPGDDLVDQPLPSAQIVVSPPMRRRTHPIGLIAVL